MQHLHYTGAVTVTKLREYDSNGTKRRALTVKTGTDEFEYAVAESLNGGTPAVGQVVGLICEAYVWNEAKISKRTGNPYNSRELRMRVVGSFDPEKASLPKLAA